MADYETIQKRRNFIVGIFVLIAIAAIGWLIFKFGDLPSAFSKWKSFEVYVQFPSAPGVQRDTPVRLAGYQIGRVTEVKPPEIRKDLNSGLKYLQSLVVLSIDRQYDQKIPRDAEAKLMTRGLGSSYIELIVDPTSTETLYLGDKVRLQGATGMTSEFFPKESQKKLDEIATGMKSLIDNANTILGDKENQENLKKSLENIAKVSGQAQETLKRIEEFASAGKTTFENLGTNFDTATASFVQTADELSMTIKRMRTILDKVNEGDGTISKLVNDGKLYESLLENSDQLLLLLNETREMISKFKEEGIKLNL
jgi:phospholipid/cholesterol/gamma-HCH transport system substrate-binding protein